MTAYQVLREVANRVFAPKENLTCTQWVEKYCSLPTKTSSKAGQYSTAYTPYVREFFNILDNNKTQVVSIVKGTQLGISLFSALALTHIAVEKQKPAIYYTINKDKCNDFAAQKFYPIVYECKKAGPIIPKNKDLLKKTKAEFNTCTVSIESASALSAFKSSSACYVFFDELDAADEFKGEAPSYKLAGDRITSYGNEGKIFYFSSPSDSNSKIWKLFIDGSQEYLEVPCKHCGEYQVLDFKIGIVFDESTEEKPLTIDQRAASAAYKCRKCGGMHYERDKLAMLDKGRWVQTNFSCTSDKRSFHISSLYSSDISWNKLTKEWLEGVASKNLDNLRHFENSRLGLVFENQIVRNTFADIEELIKLSPEYNKGVLTFIPKYIVASIDVQRDCLYYVVECVDANLDRYVLDYGKVPEFSSLEVVLQKKYTFEKEEHSIIWAWIDCGYETRNEEVFDLCMASGGVIAPVRGNKDTLYGAVDIKPSTFSYKGMGKCTRYDIRDSYYKNRLIRNIIQQKNFKLFLPKNTDDEFKRQLVDEKIVLRKRNGRVVEDFADGQRNHYFDCVKYNEACLDFMASHYQ